MNEQEKIDDLVAMLDDLMAGGKGHVNVVCNDEDGGMSVETTATSDCDCKKGACAQPTELLEESE